MNWRKTLLEQKYPNTIIETRILRAKETPLEVPRQAKTAINEKIVCFIITYNPNDLNIFSIIKQSFDNFQHSKTTFIIFLRKKLFKNALLFQLKLVNIYFFCWKTPLTVNI